jgi:hypothetical protein
LFFYDFSNQIIEHIHLNFVCFILPDKKFVLPALRSEKAEQWSCPTGKPLPLFSPGTGSLEVSP